MDNIITEIKTDILKAYHKLKGDYDEIAKKFEITIADLISKERQVIDSANAEVIKLKEQYDTAKATVEKQYQDALINVQTQINQVKGKLLADEAVAKKELEDAKNALLKHLVENHAPKPDEIQKA